MVFLDPAFGTNGKVTTSLSFDDDLAIGLVVQPDGKIVIGGSAFGFGADSDFGIARYNSNGTLDTSFDFDGTVINDFDFDEDSINDLVLQPDGKVIAVGRSLNSFDADSDFAIARYNTNGSLDSTFGFGGLTLYDFNFDFEFDEAVSTVLQPDGKLVVGGTATIAAGSIIDQDFAVTRFNSDGSLDTSFGSSGEVSTDFGFGNDAVTKLLRQPDGKILLLGEAENAAGNIDFALARYDANGNLDTSFGTSGTTALDFNGDDDGVIDAILQTDGKIVAVGKATTNGNANFSIARYNSDGTLDTSFGTGGKATLDFNGGADAASSAVIQPDGKIVVVGTAGTGSVSNIGIARYNSNGALDTNFGTGGKWTTNFSDGAIAGRAVLQADGKLLITGGAGNGSDSDFLLTRVVLNQAPTDIALSNSSIDENAAPNSTVGTLSVTDADLGDTAAYSLIAGTGDTDNAAFTIEGNVLKAKQSFDFEAKNSYNIRVKTTDSFGASFEKQLTISVGNLPEVVAPPNGTILGTPGNDPLTGDKSDNTIVGLGGDDVLLGNAGRDTLQGGDGKDLLSGGAGADILTGGEGSDRFVFDVGVRFQKAILGIDQITDFTRGTDKIVLDRTTFKKLKGKSFASVKTVTEARRSKSLITYVRGSGKLFYNENGAKAGFGQGGQFADLTDGLALAKPDLSIIA